MMDNKAFKAFIQFLNEVPINSINYYLRGTLLEPNIQQFREVIQTLEIGMRYKMAQTLIPVGNNLNFHSIQNQIPIKDENSVLYSVITSLL